MPTLATKADWKRLAERRIRKILQEAKQIRAVRTRLGRGVENVISVEFLSQPAMAELNHRYRGKNQATDILSFPAPEPFFSDGKRGELVICLPVLRRQAKEYTQSERKELDLLLVHGVLHLLGWDHEGGAEQAAEMKRFEQALLLRLSSRSLKGLLARNS